MGGIPDQTEKNKLTPNPPDKDADRCDQRTYFFEVRWGRLE